jgi:4-amino-4-deoxy-L-arabinose transferase-like glycosyltransferase
MAAAFSGAGAPGGREQAGDGARSACLACLSAPPWLVLALVLPATFLLKLRHLDHTGLTHWDEVFHAVVARNLLKHPLKPTLVDIPYLPYQDTKWSEGHIWLHKPILPLWQIALAFAVLGTNTFALRLPSALLSTGAAWLTYLIGKELLDRRSALIAAVLQTVNPFLLLLVHGYQLADHIDVALLFWVEAGVYFLARALRTGYWPDMVLAGMAQGLAYLCKSYLAAIIFGLALTAWLLPLSGLAKRESCRIGPAHLLGLLGATLLTVAPWLMYCVAHYPQQLAHEHSQVWKHLTSNVEGWGALWDRVVFDYLICLYGVFYPSVVAAAAVLFGKALRRRHMGLVLIYAWALGVIIPHLMAVTKTPSATLIGMPALLLLLGNLLSDAWSGERWPLTALTGVLAMSFVFPAIINDPGYGPPGLSFVAGGMRHSHWVIAQLAGALTAVAVVGACLRKHLLADATFLRPCLSVAARVFCLCTLVWLGIETVSAAWKETGRNVNDLCFEEVGRFANHCLPANAVLLCEERRGHEHLTLMFYADRTCYALGLEGPDVLAPRVLRGGGIPYVVSHRKLPLNPVYVSATHRWTVYLWQQLS